MSSDDDRFVVPLYSSAEAARHLDVPTSTFRSWAHGYRKQPKDRPAVVGEPIVTTLPVDAGASIPFVGLAEGYVLAAIRRAGVPLQRIRPALDRLRYELGIEHVLASRKLYTDGAEVLYDYAEHARSRPAWLARPRVRRQASSPKEAGRAGGTDRGRRTPFEP